MTTTLKKLGPGLLFAGAAIGVSHLVQSTKAGADFGLGLLWALLLVNLFKYPFEFFGTIPTFLPAKILSLFYHLNILFFSLVQDMLQQQVKAYWTVTKKWEMVS